jgi:hypothetical protein
MLASGRFPMPTKLALRSLLLLSVTGLLPAAGCGDDAAPAVGDAGGGNVGRAGSSGASSSAAAAGNAGEGAAGGADAGASSGGTESAGGPSEGGTDVGGAPPVCNDGKGAVISGRVLAPNGELPLGGVTVYVPSSTVDLPPEGSGCFRCANAFSGVPVARAITDADGRFEIAGAPVGDDVPLVVQSGKWRRTFSLAVTDCEDNAADEEATRLPAKRSEGHLPSIALISGGEDTLECLLRKLGVDDSEFAISPDAGRVQLFQAKDGIAQLANVPDSKLPLAELLWSNPERLGSFDLLLLGSETDANATAKPQASVDFVNGYAADGGRVLMQHFQSYFFAHGDPTLANLATFTSSSNLPQPTVVSVDQSSERGQSLSAVLAATSPGATAGELSVSSGKRSVTAVTAPAVRLLHSVTPASVQAFSVDVPTSGDKAGCGRITQTDLLTGSTDTVADFPSGCTSTALNAQERALAYLIFDLGACVP